MTTFLASGTVTVAAKSKWVLNSRIDWKHFILEVSGTNVEDFRIKTEMSRYFFDKALNVCVYEYCVPFLFIHLLNQF